VRMITITLRSPQDGVVELVIAANGGCEVIPISTDQLRSIALEAADLGETMRTRRIIGPYGASGSVR
jgi:hypothetical protein